MSLARSRRRVSATRIATLARRLLDASTLCAIATVSPNGRARVNTAYFAWSPTFDVVWLSAPEARHSRNLAVNRSVAIVVYDSTQSWGGRDHGIQIFGSARELAGRAAGEADDLYARRFRRYGHKRFVDVYRFYRLRPRRLKLFDERALGTGVFVTAKVRSDGGLEWTGTEYQG